MSDVTRYAVRTQPTVSRFFVDITSGMSNFFSSGAQLKTVGAPRPEVEGFTETRSTKRGRVGEGVTPSRRWGSGWPPRENFGKLPQNGAFWCILERLIQISKPKIYMKKKLRLSTCLRKDFILDTK